MQAVDQAFPRINFHFSSFRCSAGTLPAAAFRSAHTAIPFSPLQGRGSPRIYSRFFLPPHPHHTKQQITRQDHAAPFTVPSRRRSQHLVPFREETSADKPQHIDQRPGMRHRKTARSGSDPDRQLAPDPVLFLFILGTCSFFTHIPQSGILAGQRFHVPPHGSFPQFPHIIHTQRQPRRHKKNPGSLILPGFHLWSKWRDSNGHTLATEF